MFIALIMHANVCLWSNTVCANAYESFDAYKFLWQKRGEQWQMELCYLLILSHELIPNVATFCECIGTIFRVCICMCKRDSMWQHGSSSALFEFFELHQSLSNLSKDCILMAFKSIDTRMNTYCMWWHFGHKNIDWGKQEIICFIVATTR